MGLELFELSPHEDDPPVHCDRGVSPAPSADRRLHAPDVCLLATDRGSLVARCSCWWRDTPSLDGQRTGIIGHYAAAGAATDAGPNAAADADVGAPLLARACEILAAAGCSVAVGPMDGTTWRRYRLIVDRGPEPPFFLEPANPDDWPQQWQAAGFTTLATYTSAATDDLTQEDPRTDASVERLAARGVTVRAFDPSRADEELRRIFRLSLDAFSRNFLYTPISEAEFLAQNHAVLPAVRPELVLLAERNGDLAGFMLALPDVLQARRGAAVDTLILKTLAVHPSMTGLGVGGLLIDLVQRAARQLGFRRAIHALMHEANVSGRMSARYARTIRQYALFSRALGRP